MCYFTHFSYLLNKYLQNATFEIRVAGQISACGTTMMVETGMQGEEKKKGKTLHTYK